LVSSSSSCFLNAPASGFAILTNGESPTGALSIASTWLITEVTLPFGAV
jgi:hypothetical protein